MFGQRDHLFFAMCLSLLLKTHGYLTGKTAVVHRVCGRTVSKTLACCTWHHDQGIVQSREMGWGEAGGHSLCLRNQQEQQMDSGRQGSCPSFYKLACEDVILAHSRHSTVTEPPRCVAACSMTLQPPPLTVS